MTVSWFPKMRLSGWLKNHISVHWSISMNMHWQRNRNRQRHHWSMKDVLIPGSIFYPGLKKWSKYHDDELRKLTIKNWWSIFCKKSEEKFGGLVFLLYLCTRNKKWTEIWQRKKSSTTSRMWIQPPQETAWVVQRTGMMLTMQSRWPSQWKKLKIWARMSWTTWWNWVMQSLKGYIKL